MVKVRDHIIWMKILLLLGLIKLILLIIILIILNSFGKLAGECFDCDMDKIRKEDIVKSLLVMICFNIGQLSYLVGRKYNVNK